MITNRISFPWFRALTLFSLAIALFWPTLLQMESIWRHSETYMHCYFIVPMALYMVWKQAPALAGMQPTPALLPALLILPVTVLWLSAYAIDVGFVSHISQVVVFQLLLWHLLGNNIAKVIRFPLMFLIFAAPFGEALTPLLQEITADMSVVLLHFADIPVYREGLYLHTSVTIFEVADACSGLNFLISSAVIALLFNFLYFRKPYKSVIFVIFVLILAISANSVRAFLLMYMGEKTNMALGFGADHYYYGWAVFAITMLISFFIGEKFADSESQLPPTATQNTTINQLAVHTSTASNNLWTSAVALVILITIYPLQLLLPETIRPAATAAVFEIAGFDELQQNSLESSFHDGIRRSVLQNSSGLELFAADYAVRQVNGDLITWHNWLFNQEIWTITDQENIGSYRNGSKILQLTNIQGRRYTLQYWYQLGDIRSASKILIKILQLKGILLHEPVTLGVRMLAVPDQDFNTGKQCLTEGLSQLPQLIQPPKPYIE
jgi:exosortase A